MLSTIPIARQYVQNDEELSIDDKNKLKNLLDSGTIVPGAVIDSNTTELREIIQRYYPTNPSKFFLL